MWILSSSSSSGSSERSLSFKLTRIPMGDDAEKADGHGKDRKVRSVCNIGKESSSSNENGRVEVRCPVCSRSFRSKKAMHGHMRCHPERGWRGVNPPQQPSAKRTASNSSTISTAVSHDDASLPLKKRRYALLSEAEGLTLPTSKNAKPALQKAHQCRTCRKTFPTGQALGGHQTCHRTKPPQAAAPNQEVLILHDHEEARQNANPRVLHFDLNELPPMDEE